MIDTQTRYIYTITDPYHSESKSLVYILRAPANDPDDWDMVADYPAADRDQAKREAARLNAAEMQEAA